MRNDQQFHWRNAGYATFEDFLGSLASRKRKAVRKEREQALLSGDIVIEQLAGADIKEKHWDAFFDFYTDTGSRKWGRPYLNRRFFSLLGASMADRCLLIMAKRGRRYIAGALNLIGGDCLYGRYWGALEHASVPALRGLLLPGHRLRIAHRLARVEAGAQGEHKLARGYMPTPTYSAHWIADPGLRRAIARYLQDERAAVAESITELAAYGPYRKGTLRTRPCLTANEGDRLTGRSASVMIEASMPYDDNNVFAKILRGDIPSSKVYEDDDTLVFMDVMPQAPGHTLVVPKAPSRNVLDADAAVLAKLAPVVQKTARAVKEAFNADGVTVVQFNEAASGQTVFHLHYHVIPRHEGVPLMPHNRNMEKPEVLAGHAERVRTAWKA